ncbi:MAG TPA: acyltransferase [Solirubrobacterales bacterium]|nr:acyltransferase [Solirubrobacterales bacterium]
MAPSPPLSSEHRTALAGRARAVLGLRLARARGGELRWAGKPFFKEGWPIFQIDGPIDLGSNCRFRGGPVRTRLITRSGGRIVFGDAVGINFGVEILAEHLITIGDGAAISPHVTIFDTNFHPLGEGDEIKGGPVAIGANAWIGRQALILPGVTIGDHSVVASGAVVTHDVPPRMLVAGNPARTVREIDASDGWRRL